jgi:SHS2 domain-containing protein
VYRWVDHTSELELEIEAASEREVLSDGLHALRELLEAEGGSGSSRQSSAKTAPGERRAVEVTASDRPTLLAAWLEELVFLAESSGFLPLDLEQLSLGAQRLDATVAGRTGEPRPLVKAVTYHRLEFAPTDRGYRARVVFDV